MNTRGPFNDPQYVYRAVVRRVYDGDTVTVDIDLGLNVWVKDQTLRLYGIDTPELRGNEREEGLVVRDFVRSQIPRGTEVIIETRKDKTGKYGRWLATIWVNGLNLNNELWRRGMAKRYMLD